MKMEEFALGIFANTDKADRESPEQPPDISLAGRFYISSLFFDVVSQFHEHGQLPPDLEEKRKYAKYRTLQIRNRKPLDVEPTSVPVVVVDTTAPANSASPSLAFKYADDHPSPKTVTAESTPSLVDSIGAKKRLQQAVSAIDFGDLKTAARLATEAAKMLGK